MSARLSNWQMLFTPYGLFCKEGDCADLSHQSETSLIYDQFWAATTWATFTDSVLDHIAKHHRGE